MADMNNIISVKRHLETHNSTKNLTWKENKQKASLAIYNYINKELQKFSIDYKKDNLNEINKKTEEIKKIKKTLKYVLDELQKSFNSGNEISLPKFVGLELNEETKKQLNQEVYDNLTDNSTNESKKLSENLLKNLKIIVTHKNTDGIFNNSNTKTSLFASSLNKYNKRTDTHEKIRQAITNNKEAEQLSVIKGLIDKSGIYSGKASTYYYKPHWYSIFDKPYKDKNGFGIFQLSSQFNYAMVKAKWKNGVPVSGQIKSHDKDDELLKNNIEFIRNKDGSYTFKREVKNSDETISKYEFTTKTFTEKLDIITGTLESLDKLPKDMALENKQMILEKTCHKMDSITFLKEFNDDFISSKLTTNNYISTLKTPRGYDKSFTASATMAVVYHLIKVSDSLGDSIINNNKVDLDKLECYINLFMNLPKDAVAQIIKYAKTMHISELDQTKTTISLKGYKLFLSGVSDNVTLNLKDLSEIIKKNKNTQALMHANDNKKQIYGHIINKLINSPSANEGAADKSLSNLLNYTIGAHESNKTQKDKKHNIYNRVKEVLGDRVSKVINSELSSEMGVLPNGNKLVLLNKSLPSAFNKLNKKDKIKLITELQEEKPNTPALEDMLYWPINTYQLKNSNNEVLQTMTGSFIDKDSETNKFRCMCLLDSLGGDNYKNKIFYVSRLLDTSSENTKIKKDQETLRSAAKQLELNLLVRQAHFSEGFWDDKKGSGFNMIEGKDHKDDAVKSITDELTNVYQLIDEKFPLNIENNADNDYINVGLKNMSCEFFKLMANKNLTASQKILLNTLQIILKNKLPEFNVVAILGCKSAKDRTMMEIATECALQTTIENAFFNIEETRKLEKPIDLELLVKNNKINAEFLNSELKKTFIDNFDDAILYTANAHDNRLYTNQNAKTHFKVLEDFSYHRKFKQPYKKIIAGS